MATIARPCTGFRFIVMLIRKRSDCSPDGTDNECFRGGLLGDKRTTVAQP